MLYRALIFSVYCRYSRGDKNRAIVKMYVTLPIFSTVVLVCCLFFIQTVFKYWGTLNLLAINFFCQSGHMGCRRRPSCISDPQWSRCGSILLPHCGSGCGSGSREPSHCGSMRIRILVRLCHNKKLDFYMKNRLHVSVADP